MMRSQYSASSIKCVVMITVVPFAASAVFWRQITALAAKGTTVIITTHFMDEAEYCDRIMIQDQGKMLILGTPEEVRNRGGKNLTMNEAFIAIVENSRRKEEL